MRVGCELEASQQIEASSSLHGATLTAVCLAVGAPPTAHRMMRAVLASRMWRPRWAMSCQRVMAAHSQRGVAVGSGVTGADWTVMTMAGIERSPLLDRDDVVTTALLAPLVLPARVLCAASLPSRFSVPSRAFFPATSCHAPSHGHRAHCHPNSEQTALWRAQARPSSLGRRWDAT